MREAFASVLGLCKAFTTAHEASLLASASFIVVIHKVTGKEGYFALFEDYPKECYEKLDEYEWFTEQPSKRPLKIASTDKLLHEKFRYVRDVHVPDPQAKLSDIFGKDATVKDLLDSLGHDSLEIFRQEQ